VPEPPIRVLYVAGVPHCGSTIISNILGQVDGAFHGGELRYFPWRFAEDRPCGCGEPLSRCPVWSKVVAGMQEKDIQPEDLATWPGSWYARDVPAMLVRERCGSQTLGTLHRSLSGFYAAIAEETGSRLIVDSSKAPAWGLLVERTPGIDLHVLHVVRDPHASGYSWQRAENEQNPNPVRFGLIWSIWNAEIEALWRRRAGRYLAVRYEDFVAEPRPTIERILSFAGEAPGALPFTDERTVELSPTHSVAGHRTRFDAGRVALRSDNDWRGRLPRSSRLAISSLTWPLARRY
jgi:Sulfotransferase family